VHFDGGLDNYCVLKKITFSSAETWMQDPEPNRHQAKTLIPTVL
jgi:hypothetical protein